MSKDRGRAAAKTKILGFVILEFSNIFSLINLKYIQSLFRMQTWLPIMLQSSEDYQFNYIN